MKPITKTPLQEIRAEEELLKAKDAQLQKLGLSLAEEKLKNIEKDAMISKLGQEIAQLKIDIIMLKGAVG